MESVTMDKFDADDEVHLFMKDRIKNDVCLCKKYGIYTGGSNKRKACPTCCDDKNQGEPRKRHRGLPTSGNYGRTGCLAKPDLCTILEHDVLSHVTSELLHKFGITITAKNRNKTVKEKQNLPNPKPHDIGFIDREYLGEKQLKKVPKIDDELVNSECVCETKDLCNGACSLLINSTGKDHVRSYGATDERVSLKTNHESDFSDRLLQAKGNLNPGSAIQESYIQMENPKSGDAKENELQFWRKQKPSLIPARVFINHYLISPQNSRSFKEKGSMNFDDSSLETTKNFQLNDNMDQEMNKCDSQTIIDGISCITINHLNYDDHCNNIT